MPVASIGTLIVSGLFLLAIMVVMLRSGGRLTETKLVSLGLITGVAAILYESAGPAFALSERQGMGVASVSIQGAGGALPGMLMRLGVVLLLSGVASFFLGRLNTSPAVSQEETHHAP